MDALKELIAHNALDGGYASVLTALHRAGFEARLVGKGFQRSDREQQPLTVQFRVPTPNGSRYFSITVKEHL